MEERKRHMSEVRILFDLYVQWNDNKQWFADKYGVPIKEQHQTPFELQLWRMWQNAQV